MTETVTESQPNVPFLARYGPIMALGGLVLAALVAIVLVVRLADREEARDLRAWQDRLNIIADSRFAAVETWLADQRAALRKLAENASIQLYMTELDLAGGDPSGVTDEAAQRVYLRNLLVAAAARDGFEAAQPGAEIAANIERAGTAGLALLTAKGEVVVATPTMPALDAAARATLEALANEPAVIDLYLGSAGTPTMGFAAPVFAIQGDASSAPIGFVVGLKEVADELFPLLSQPGATGRTVETVLVRRDGERIVFLSPLADRSAPLAKALAADTPDLAEASALERPGGFARLRDYADHEVLVVGRAFRQVPWGLVTKVDAAEALAPTRERRAGLITISLLVIAGLVAVVVAAWWHGTSRREALAARTARELAARLDAQRRFLKVVTDSQPIGLAIIDGDQRLSWVNRFLCALVGAAEADVVIDKPMASVFGPLPAKTFEDAARRAIAEGRTVEETVLLAPQGRDAVVRAQFLPLGPEEGQGGRTLLVAEDITPVIEARERRVRLMRQLVATLVKVIDRRDPHATDQSSWVSEVARAIAEEMSAEPHVVETAAIAGQLMNLGKIFVPEALLTKKGRLSDEELAHVRNALGAGADLLRGVEFDGPVAETLHQLQERFDGKGQPAALAGEAILMPARIVAVANAFVGMVSPRSWRAGLALPDAVERLMADHGQIFDPKVIVALANRVANRGGAEAWARFGQATTES